jgi:hypothetical protein
MMACETSSILNQQATLQAEANAIVDVLDLDNALRGIGNAVRVGSSALGVMVRRDIDITVICDRLDQATHSAVVQLGGKLALHPSIGVVSFRNDSGFWNKSPEEYPDGLYLGLTYRERNDEDWNFDIWFVDAPERQPDLKHLQTVLPKLSTTARETILKIKTALATGSLSSDMPVSSFLVYDAVLNAGVNNVAEFEAWLKGGCHIN